MNKKGIVKQTIDIKKERMYEHAKQRTYYVTRVNVSWIKSVGKATTFQRIHLHIDCIYNWNEKSRWATPQQLHCYAERISYMYCAYKNILRCHRIELWCGTFSIWLHSSCDLKMFSLERVKIRIRNWFPICFPAIMLQTHIYAYTLLFMH